MDRALKTLTTRPVSQRANPATDTPEVQLSEHDRRRSAALLRVNHAGEIAAQALYEGIDVPGKGSVGLITYMRTDSTDLSKEALT